MALIDLWEKSKHEIEEKHVRQIIQIGGDGKLRDGSATADEFRMFLSAVPSELLTLYVNQCLQDAFTDSGMALQDIVNQIGMRLGFDVTTGRYRGVSGQIGFDGLWRLPEGHSIVVEVKTTDAYRIKLHKIAQYREQLIEKGKISELKSSILIVVGREDTGGLEAQIRGSRHAWDIRLISVDALTRLMSLKQEVEDPKIVKLIYDILIPREFTKLDEIVNIVFSTAEEIKQDDTIEIDTGTEEKKPKFTPVSFHKACVERVQKQLSRSLIKQTKSYYLSSDGSIALICAVSKEHIKSGFARYWFAFHPHQKELLEKATDSYVAFGCGSEATVALIPSKEFIPWLEEFNITEKPDSFYWHIHITYTGEKLIIHRKKGADEIDITKFVLSN